MVHPRREDYALHEGFWIEDWFVEPRSNQITDKDGQELRVEPKVMGVLECLAERPGKTVTKATFMEHVWEDTIVTDDVLARCVSQLRKVFEDDPRHPHIIETIRKRGYRLIAPVAVVQAGTDMALVKSREAPVQVLHPRRDPLASISRPVGTLLVVAAIMVTIVGVYFALRPDEPILPKTVPFTSFPGEELDPALSPDGEQVVFAWTGEDGTQPDLYIKQAGSESLLPLTDDLALEHSPAWSPDGRQIAFARTENDTTSIVITPSIGGGGERIVANLGLGEVRGIVWSPDGDELGLSAQQAPREPFSILLLSVETLEMKQLTEPPTAYRGDLEPAFSPNGRRLAFVRSIAEGNEDVYVISILTTGSLPRRLTQDQAEITGLDWTPNGGIIFTSDREGTSGLWRISATGSGLTLIQAAAQGSSLQQPSVARDADRLTFAERVLDTNVWQVRNTGASRDRLISSTRWDSNPQVSPDNSKIAFASKRSGSQEIWICDRDGSNPVQLTFFQNGFTSTPRWSPNGHQIAFEARPDGDADIFITDVRSNAPRRLTIEDEGADDIAPSWSRDSLSVYFASNRSGDWQIWKQPADSGAAAQVTMTGALAAFEGPDGRSLLYVKPDTTGIWQLVFDTGEETMLLDGLDPIDWGNWTIHKNGIYFIHRSGANPRIDYYSFRQRRSWAVMEMDDVPEHPSFAVSPDGQWFLYTHVDRSESDILMVEDFQ